jgi:outer membrane protein TolC
MFFSKADRAKPLISNRLANASSANQDAGRPNHHMYDSQAAIKSHQQLVNTLIDKKYALRTLRIVVACVCCGNYSGKAQSTTPSATAPITIDEAIRRAQAVETTYGAALADAGVAQAQTGIARSTLLPGVVYHNQFLYTQGTLTQTAARDQTTPNSQSTAPVRFIANNAVHEYISQGVVSETFGGAGVADYRRANAEAASARARLEVSRRGLVATVVEGYYSVLASDAKVAIANRALAEANNFGTTTRQREAGGEVAHADTVRADLLQQQRQRELNDAVLAADKAHIELGVLLFSDPTTTYTLAAALDPLPALPTRAEIEGAAKSNNPDVRAAFESLRSADLEVAAARFGYAPDLSLNYAYGIDAAQFAIHASDGTRNLGYSAWATLDIPVWDWFATHNRVKQSTIRRTQLKAELTLTQRRLIASLDELYKEASVAQAQMTLFDQSVQTATESLHLTNLRYAAGEGTVLEVVDAQNSLVTAESSRADGAVRYQVALANLQTLTGNMP